MPESQKPRQLLDASENLMVGCVGGMLETSILMPVLTWKFCTQEGRPYPRFPGMYRGVFVQAGSVAPITAVQMVANGILEKAMGGGSRQLSDMETVGCAMGAGAFSATVYTPVDMTMIHQQKLGMNPMQTVQHLVKNHGVLSPWRGFAACAGREGIYTAGYLGIAPVLTKKIMSQPGWENSYYLSSVIASCVGGVVANMTSHPIDTCKTVVQADVKGEQYKSAISASAKLLQEQGLRGLFLGGLARTIRTCGAFFIVSSLREQAILNKTNNGGMYSFS